ncbi:zinc ribbon domain-containing protein, partial [Amycolatopsis mediterranei]
MVIYAECGHQGPADVEFCGECGRYLKWDDDGPVAVRSQPVVQQQQQQQQQVVQPAEPIAPVRQPVQQTVEEQILNPGDLICGRCGKGNAPARNFCSRCGASLAESEVVKTSWWRRLFGRKPKELKAGARPGKDGVRRRTAHRGRPLHALLVLRVGDV